MAKPNKRCTPTEDLTHLLPARVTANYGRHFIVCTEDNQTMEAHRRGKKGDVVIGDNVLCTPPVSGISAIEKIQERHNLLYRSDQWRTKSLASNIDQVAIVFASRPTFNRWFIWKALLAAHKANIPALVIRNKKDLSEGAQNADNALKELALLGIDTFNVSAQGAPEETFSLLMKHFKGKSTLFVGQSGMGKSTLLNLLVPQAKAFTQEFSIALDLGKQTTTAAHWYTLEGEHSDTAIIDTPGFQEFGLAHMGLNDIIRAMPDIAQYSSTCRFANCRHLLEPGCSVKKALDEGKITVERYEFYKSLAEHADPYLP